MTTTIRPFREYDPVTQEIILNLHEGQMRALGSQRRFVVMLAGTQGGKSVFGPHWLHNEILQHGAGDYLAVTSTYDMFKLKMLPEIKNTFEEILLDIDGAPARIKLDIGRYWGGNRVLEIAEDLKPGQFWAKHQDDPMWARIILRSADAKAGLEAATVKAAWLDEAGQKEFPREAWEATLRRLSLAQGRVLITTTLYGLTWLKTDLYDPWKAGSVDIDIIQYASVINPAFPQAEFDRAVATLPRWKVAMFYRGEFDRPAGLIYDAFDEAVAVLPRFDIPATWPRYVGMDFGQVNTAALFFAQDPNTGWLYVYREYLAGGESAWGHAEKLKELSKGESIVKRVGGAQTEDGWRESFTAAGWPVSKPKIKEVEVGIDRVYGWHSTGRLFVFNDMVRYLDEKLSYTRKLDHNLEPTQDIENKSAYHLMDAERYLLTDFAPEVVRKTQGRPTYLMKPTTRGF